MNGDVPVKMSRRATLIAAVFAMPAIVASVAAPGRQIR